jgi:transposase InsO family protein
MSTSGYQYYMVIVDDFSHYFGCFPLVDKSDAFATIQFFSHVNTQFCTPIRSFQTDNGKEFMNHASTTIFDSRGIQLCLSCPYSSPQNAKAERAIHTVNDTMRTLLLQAHMPPSFWAESLASVVHVLNL